MGYGLEVDMIRLAHDMDLLTCPYVFNEDEAVAMTKAGADMLVPHMGLTTKGSIGAHDRADAGRERRRASRRMHDAAKRVRKDVLVLCHGGPIAEPEDAQVRACRARRAWSASSAPAAWSACRPRWPSPRTRGGSSG